MVDVCVAKICGCDVDLWLWLMWVCGYVVWMCGYVGMDVWLCWYGCVAKLVWICYTIKIPEWLKSYRLSRMIHRVVNNGGYIVKGTHCLTFRVPYRPIPPLAKHAGTSRSAPFRPSMNALVFREIPVRLAGIRQ